MKYLLLIFLVLIFVACDKDDIKPPIYYNNGEAEAEDLEKFKDTISQTLLPLAKD